MKAFARKKLVEIATIERKIVAPEAIAPKTLYVGLEHIANGGDILGAQSVERGELASAKFCFNCTHVLYGKLRPYLAKIALPDFDGVCSTDILPIKPREQLDRRFLYHYLRQPELVDLASSQSAGANLPRLSPSTLEAFEIPLPPLPEQRRIADILDRADLLRTQRKTVLKQLALLSHAIFHEMFGILQSSAWKVVTVAEVAACAEGAIRTGPFGSQLLHSEFVDEGIAVLGIDNAVENTFQWSGRRFITAEKYQQLRRYTVHPGDVIITIMGTCGRCAVVPDDIPLAINTKHLCCISLDHKKCLPSYLHAYFLHNPRAIKHLRSAAKGAIMSGLNMAIIKSMPLVLPPIDLQADFQHRLAALESQIGINRMSLVELDALFNSLQHRAFRGEL